MRADKSHVNLIKICNNGIYFVSFCIVHRTYFSRGEQEMAGKSNVNRHRYHTKDAIHSIQRCVNGIFVCVRFFPPVFSNQTQKKKKQIFALKKKENYEVRDFFNTLMRIYLAFAFVFAANIHRAVNNKSKNTHTHTILQIKV